MRKFSRYLYYKYWEITSDIINMRKVNEYYRKLIDINDASQKNITEIFRKVYELDEVYANRMNELVDRLKYVTQKLVDIHERINPR